MKKFSMVVPVYFNEQNLPETIPKLLALKNDLPNYDFEIIFVDDGSGDRSLEILLSYHKQHKEIIRIVKFTRNFGSMAAIQAGFLLSKGDCIGVIAADLQDPPELFIEMINFWEQGAKAIYAVRQDREEPFYQKLFSKIFYFLLRHLALSDFPKGGFDFFLIDRQIVNSLNKIQEKNTNIMSLIHWLGFDPVYIPYTRKSRKYGKSKWTFSKKVGLLIDTFISFSNIPIRAVSIGGIALAFFAFTYGAIVFANWLVNGVPVTGWISTILVISLTSGFQLMTLGIVGEYLLRTLGESRKRPSFIIDDVYQENPTQSSSESN
jgi:dolichol-phosphate mannosyltransferase